MSFNRFKHILQIIFCTLYFTCAPNCIKAQAELLQIVSSPTRSREIYLQKLQSLPCGIAQGNSKVEIVNKLTICLQRYQPDPNYKDDVFIKAATEQALLGLQSGGYGIGAILVDEKGKIILAAHNEQLQKRRSDLHAEMNLLNKFEDNPKLNSYKNGLSYRNGLRLYSSTEPCPMCFTRLIIVGLDSFYGASGPDDGMASRHDLLPPTWRELSEKHPSRKAESSPFLQAVAHLAFYSYLLEEN